MSVARAALLMSLCLLAFGCLPKKSEVATCIVDRDCASRMPGLRCDTARGVCVCDPANSPKCDHGVDAAATDAVGGSDEALDSSTAGLDTLDSGTAGLDTLDSDTVGLDIPDSNTVDMVLPQCRESVSCGRTTPICKDGQCVACASSSQCGVLGDPTRGICTGAGACAECAANGDCGGAAPLCDPATNRCVECLASASCPATTPVCTNKKCTACTASSQCAVLGDPMRAVCAGSGVCVQCMANADCSGATPVCDMATNTCQTCVTDVSCGGDAPICVRKTCVPCTAASQCMALGDPLRAVCAGSGACVQCTASSDCSGSAPVCDTTIHTCQQCLASSTCGGVTPICAAKVCTACTSSTQCAGLRDPQRATCATTGACVQCIANSDCSGATPVCDTSANKCVQCLTSTSCGGNTPICVNKTCTACTSSSQCAAFGDPTRAVCSAAGACVQCTSNAECAGAAGICDPGTHKCVQCLTHASCGGTTPLCSNQTCVGCSSSSGCAVLSDPARAACAADGACVQCTDDSTCAGTTPVCTVANRRCRGCTVDGECAGRGPGVCMGHQDGRCATEDESTVLGPGSALPSASGLVGKRLVVFRGTVSGAVAWTLGTAQLTVVGQNGAALAGTGGATMHLTGGDVFIRNLGITGGSPGLWIDGGGVVRLDHVSVSNNAAGGILIDGAGFTIVNTTVTANGAVNSLDGIWAGLRLQNLPPASAIPKSLKLSTVSSNQQVGISCASDASSLLVADGVLAANNVGGVDIGLACGFSSCGSATSTCGAQP